MKIRNKLLLIILFLLFLFCTYSVNAEDTNTVNLSNQYSSASNGEYWLGDVNSDNKINIRDIIKIRKYIANQNKWNLTESEKNISDVNRDKKINIRDIIKIRKYIAASSNTTIANKHPNWLNLYKITITSISVTHNPTKTNYKKGESLNLSGGIITVNYSDNTTSQINLNSSQITVTGFNSSQLGEQTLTVSYLGKTTTFKVNIYSDKKYDISTNTLNNGDVILAGSTFEMYIDINISNYNVDTSKVRILDPNEISLSGAIVNTTNSIEKGGATTSNFNVTKSGNRIKISAKTSDGIDKIGYLVIELGEGFLTATNYSNTRERYTYYVASLNASTKLNNNKVSLTTTVGVHNSFYIKNYYYGNVDTNYAQNISATGKTASTTNEYTYTNLTNNSHRITVEIVFYVDKNNTTYEKRGMISKNVEVSINNNEVEIHYIDLAKGSNISETQESIFLKIPYGNSYKTMLIDSGRLGTVDTLDKYLRKDKKIVTTAKTTGGLDYVPIDYLIITHFDGDHYGGLVSTETNNTLNSSLTGITYDETNGYSENRKNNKLNGEQMFYYFKNIILPCNYEDMLTTNGLKALASYAKKRNLIKATAGNVLQIGNVSFNIFNPYPTENVPLNWLGDYYKGTQYFRDSDWVCSEEGSLRKENNTTIYNENGKGLTRLAQTYTNNTSVVTKLIVGGEKTLLTGDLTFYGEEILLGKIPEELSGNNGLEINEKVSSNAATNYISLVKELKKLQENKNLSTTELDNKYHLSRFTKKDLSSNILKKGHHYYWNSTSKEFLNNVKPSKVILTNAKYDNSNAFKACVKYDSLKYRLTDYFNLSNSNWSNYIYGTFNNTIISYSNGSVSK